MRRVEIAPSLGFDEALRNISNPGNTAEQLIGYAKDCRTIAKASFLCVAAGSLGLAFFNTYQYGADSPFYYLTNTAQIGTSLIVFGRGTYALCAFSEIAERIVGIGKKRGLKINIPWYLKQKEPGITFKRPEY